MANSYNKNYDFVYHTDDEAFDIEHMNSNFDVAANEFDMVYDLVAEKAPNNHGHSLSNTNITGILPINKGGTGANNVTKARDNLGLGSSATRGVTGKIAPGNTDLPDSSTVYWALNNLEILMQRKFCYLIAVDNTVNDDGSCDCDSKYIKAADFVFNCKNGYSDTYSLNNFINRLPSGSKVIFAPGSYLISNSIKINTRITLEGLNHRATFFIKNDVPILVIGEEGSDEANNVTIRNIYLMQYPFNDAQPPNHGNTTYYSFSSPIFKLTNSNGVYIERCGIYAHSFRTPDNGYNSIVQCHGYATNCTIEKCVLNTTITSLKDSSSKPTGFILDVSDCPKQYSYKLIANFGTTTAYRGNTVAEISNVGCTGFKIYNNDRL